MRNIWKKLKNGWLIFGEKLGWFNSRILLSIIFIFILGIYGIFWNFFNFLYKIFIQKNKTTNWKNLEIKTTLEDLENQF